MSLTCERDDDRRLIVVTAGDVPQPVTVDEMLAVIDRQWSEGLWHYALLYEFRGSSYVATDEEAKLVEDRLVVLGSMNPRGPVGLVVTRPAAVRRGLSHADRTRGMQTFELLTTDAQVDEWLSRYARPSRDGGAPSD
jgi:hypothetical protein